MTTQRPDYGDDLAAYFRATLGDAPPLHPMSSHLPTRDEALAVAAKHYAISCVSKDAAREAAFGTDIEREQRQDAEQDLVTVTCEDCGARYQVDGPWDGPFRCDGCL